MILLDAKPSLAAATATRRPCIRRRRTPDRNRDPQMILGLGTLAAPASDAWTVLSQNPVARVRLRLAIVPFLRDGVVAQHHWLTERTISLDSVAMGLINPGTVPSSTARFILPRWPGYPVRSWRTIAIFHPDLPSASGARPACSCDKPRHPVRSLPSSAAPPRARGGARPAKSSSSPSQPGTAGFTAAIGPYHSGPRCCASKSPKPCSGIGAGILVILLPEAPEAGSRAGGGISRCLPWGVISGLSNWRRERWTLCGHLRTRCNMSEGGSTG